MAYTKQNFNDGEVLYATQLNNMDNQIEANTNAINTLENLRVNDNPDTITTYISDGGRKPMRAMISFIDDDCRREVYENVVDGIDCSLLSVIGEKDDKGNIKINIPYMLACPPGDIFDEDTNTGKSNYMTKNQLLNMYHAGVKLSCHHLHQYNMDDTEFFQDIDDYDNDLKSCQEKFLSWGINDVNTVSYPQGKYIDDFMNVVKKYYKMGFTVTNGVNSIPYESYYMKRVGLFANSASQVTLKIINEQSLGASGGTVDKSTGVRCEPISVSEGEEYVVTCSANWGAACYAFWDNTNTPMEGYIAKSAENANGTKLVDYRVRVPAGARSMIVGANTAVDPNGTVSISKIANKSTIATAKSYVDQVANEGGWLVFMTHAWYKWFNADDLKELIEYIQEQGIEIVSANEALKNTGNVIETGIFKKPLEDAVSPYFVVDIDGRTWSYQPGQVNIPEYEKNVQLTLVQNKLIDKDGKIATLKTTDLSYVVTDPIDVTDCKALIISGFACDGNCLYSFYDENNYSVKKKQISDSYNSTEGEYHFDVNVPKTAKTVVVAGYTYKQMPLVRKVYAYDHLRTYARNNDKAAINELYDQINGFKSETIRSVAAPGKRLSSSTGGEVTISTNDADKFIISELMAVDTQYDYYIISGAARSQYPICAIFDANGMMEDSLISNNSDEYTIAKQQKIIMPEGAQTFRVASYLGVQPDGFQIIGVKESVQNDVQYVRKGWTTEQVNLLEQLLGYVTWNNDAGNAIAEQLIASLKG